MITLGGDAELELVDSLDPFSEGTNHYTLHTRYPIMSTLCLSPSHRYACTSHSLWQYNTLLYQKDTQVTPKSKQLLSTTPSPALLNHPLSCRYCLFSTTSQEKLEKYFQFIGWRKDIVFIGVSICPSSLQAQCIIRDGRNWCSLGFQKCTFWSKFLSCHSIVSILQTSIFILHDLSHDVLITAMFISVCTGIHRRQLHQRTYQECTICDHFPP
jgi:hypothetical protein